MYRVFILTLTLILVGVSPIMSFSEIEEDSIKDCKEGEYFEYIGLGSWAIKIKKSDATSCFLSYESEIEMGRNQFQCEVPLNEMKVLRFDEDDLPFSMDLVNKYCTGSKDTSIVIVGGIIIAIVVGSYFLYRKRK